ncbi:MAG: sugar kinase [Rubrobacter sp.]|nr:sugar kinase [Rubrobacter sp.]
MSLPRPVVVVGDVLYDMLAYIGGGDGPAPGVDTFTPIHASPGGSAANVASHLARLGVETHFVGRAGDDPFGEFLSGGMERVGVKAHIARDRELSTGKVFVMVDGEGERTMITDRGASEALGPEDLPEGVFSPNSHLHLTGYTFSGGSRRDAAMKALRLAREAGMSVSVDPSSALLLESIGPERFLKWMRGVDLCFPNLEEGALLSGSEDPESVAEGLLGHCRAVALKLGAGGAMYADGSGRRTRQSAAEVPVVDTTGAGDAFCAGFLSGWIAGEDAGDSLRKGIALAGEVAGGFGGTTDTGLC